MNWQDLKNQGMTFFVFLLANPIFLYLIFGIVLFLVIFGKLSSCRERQAKKRIERIKEQILEDKIKANILQNTRKDLEKEVNNAQTDSNKTLDNFNNSVRRDSNQYNGANAGKRFCERFPEDSSCR